VVAKLDRLSRSVQDFAGRLDLSTRQGWAVVALDLGVDTTTLSGRLVAHVLSAVSGWERDVIRQRTHDALAERKAAGARLGRERMTPPDTAARIVSEWEAGQSASAIARGLDAERVPPPNDGVRWYPPTVSPASRTRADTTDRIAPHRDEAAARNWVAALSYSGATVLDVSEPRTPVDEENTRRWTAVAHSARVHHRVMMTVGEPQPGSNLADVGELYPFEKVADRVRSYITAGIEHMVMWADFTAPLKFHEEQVTNHTLRPAYTLSRATIEASAQAVWILNTLDPMECVRRHLSLIRWDLQEHRKSKLDLTEKRVIQMREDDLIRRVSSVFTAAEIKPPTGYLEVIRSACDAKSLDLDADAAERLWRAASGAAHGKYWPTLELQSIELGEEYEPNRFRSIQLPNASAMTEVLEAANTISSYAVVMYAQYSGAHVAAILREAMEWLGERVPLKPGATRDDLDRIRQSVERPDAEDGTTS
jgi:hypothetical protein